MEERLEDFERRLGRMEHEVRMYRAAAVVAVADGLGRERVWLAVRLGSPVLQFLDARGSAQTGLSTFNEDTGVAVVSATDRSRPGLVLLGRDGTVVWSAP